MSVVAEFTVMPVGTGEHVSPQIAHAVEVVARSGLNYKLCPMGTVLEGELDQVFNVIRQCQERLAQECNRMIISVRVDWRKEPGVKMDQFVQHVQQQMGQKAKT